MNNNNSLMLFQSIIVLALISQRRRLLAVLGAAACILWAAPVAAQQFSTVSVGNVAIVIPNPPDLVSLEQNYPQLVAGMEASTPAAQRLLAGFVSPTDIDRLKQQGLVGSISVRYATVTVLREYETETFTFGAFSTVKDYLRDQAAVSVKAAYKEARTSPPSLYQKAYKIAVEKPGFLGVFDETPQSISILSTVSSEGTVKGHHLKNVQLVSATTLWVTGKVLYLYVLGPFQGESDATWLKQATLRWTHAVIQANRADGAAGEPVQIQSNFAGYGGTGPVTGGPSSRTAGTVPSGATNPDRTFTATNPSDQAAPAKAVPPWTALRTSPEFTTLDDAGKEEFREIYWRDYLAPTVPDYEIDEAREKFDNESIPDSPSAIRTLETLKQFMTPPSLWEVWRASVPPPPGVTCNKQSYHFPNGRTKECTTCQLHNISNTVCN